MAQYLQWLNQQLLPKTSPNLTAGIVQQLLDLNHDKEQDVWGNLWLILQFCLTLIGFFVKD